MANPVRHHDTEGPADAGTPRSPDGPGGPYTFPAEGVGGAHDSPPAGSLAVAAPPVTERPVEGPTTDDAAYAPTFMEQAVAELANRIRELLPAPVTYPRPTEGIAPPPWQITTGRVAVNAANEAAQLVGNDPGRRRILVSASVAFLVSENEEMSAGGLGFLVPANAPVTLEYTGALWVRVVAGGATQTIYYLVERGAREATRAEVAEGRR